MNRKDQFIEALEAKIEEWNAEIAVLEARLKGAKVEAEIELQHQLENLKSQRSKVEERLTELSESSMEAFDDLKVGVELAFHQLGDAVKAAISRYK